jgi:hypothetical protein
VNVQRSSIQGRHPWIALCDKVGDASGLAREFPIPGVEADSGQYPHPRRRPWPRIAKLVAPVEQRAQNHQTCVEIAAAGFQPALHQT